MKVFINNNQVDKNLVDVNAGLNFGRFNYENLSIANYKIKIPVLAFIELIEADYNCVRDDTKLDDYTQNETSVLKTINYGSIQELLQHSRALQEVMDTYLNIALFQKLFSESTNSIYIINSTDLIEIVGDTLEISGRSFRKQ